MEKQNKGLVAALIVMLLIIVGLTAYIVIDKTNIFDKKDNEVVDNKENSNEEKEGFIEKDLDINSELVQNLYSNVKSKYISPSYFGWLYYNHIDNINVDELSGYDKMKFVYNIIDESMKIEIDCNGIPDTYDQGIHESVCAYNRRYNIDSNQYAYSKDYINSIYKRIYGVNISDTNACMPGDVHGVTKYCYIEAVDKYVLYTFAGGGTFGDTYELTIALEKAIQYKNEIKLYETVTAPVTSEYTGNYVYTFKLGEDGTYGFYSRVKE